MKHIDIEELFSLIKQENSYDREKARQWLLEHDLEVFNKAYSEGYQMGLGEHHEFIIEKNKRKEEKENPDRLHDFVYFNTKSYEIANPTNEARYKNNEWVEIDKGIVENIRGFYIKGYPTQFSCEGNEYTIPYIRFQSMGYKKFKKLVKIARKINYLELRFSYEFENDEDTKGYYNVTIQASNKLMLEPNPYHVNFAIFINKLWDLEDML